MSTPDFDPNMWYQLWTGNDGGQQSYVGTAVFTASGTRGAVFFNPTNTSSESQKWQVLRLSSTTWAMRTKEGGSRAYHAAMLSTNETTPGSTRPCMVRGDVVDASAFWTFAPWEDGTWYLTNAANGTDYHLNRKSNGLLAMSPNVTAPQNGQRWQWKTNGPIDNALYSTAILAGTTIVPGSSTFSASASTASFVSSSMSSSPSFTSSASNHSSSTGLSGGAKAAIGASVGGVALIALVVLGLLWFRKPPKQGCVNPKQHELLSDEIHYVDGKPVRYEVLQNKPPVEAPENQRPAELMAEPVLHEAPSVVP